MNGDVAEEMLRALGEVLEEKGEKADLVICGGMALVLQHMSSRPTRDVDAMALVKESAGRLEVCKPILSAQLRDAIERVGVVYGKGRNWLNAAAIILHDETQLPEGLLDRALVKHYESCLTIRLLSQEDMVRLKMWAALQRSGPDIVDLLEIEASEADAEKGFEWCLEQDGDREALLVILSEMGHGQLAERLG